MGKRKRSDYSNTTNTNPLNPPSSDNMPCSSVMELQSKEAYPQHRIPHNLGRSIFLKRSRHHYGHQYSRRNSGNHGSSSSMYGKSPVQDEKLSFKLASQCHTDPGHHTEIREKLFSRPERIRFGSVLKDFILPDEVKMECGICQKLSIHKPDVPWNSMFVTHYDVVAVLVCGHVYHAECLEQRTSVEHASDPICLLCSGLVTKGDASGSGSQK